MRNDTDQQLSLADAGRNQTAFIEDKINRLKVSLEEKQARSHTTAKRKGMIEDCEIILKHLESKAR